MGEKFDFSGYATRNDLQCADGRVIKRDAFVAQNNQRVPLVWQHQHNDPSNVLGHALLENRADGVYCYGTFNNTELGRTAKELVANGDVSSLSIYANQLKHNGSEVLHGVIREVSLVIAGANPGAYIDNPVLAHSGETVLSEAIIYQPDQDLMHSDAEEEKKEDQEEIPEKKEDENMAEAEKKDVQKSDKTVGEIFDELTEEQKEVVYFMIGQAIQDASTENNANNSNDEGEEMKHNVFDNEAYGPVLTHSDVAEILGAAKRYGSLKDACEAFCANNDSLMHAIQDRNGHEVSYGIADIDLLFPDYKTLVNEPGFVKRNPDSWVSTVMNGVHHTPFSRIKMLFGDLREDDARAKGYTKGGLKKEEVFGLLKRTVDPTTVYKKQKLDRDDIVDITDFGVVAWLKSEMRMMLDEEIARAILFGDGRTSLSADKISESHIIPACKDASLYNITAVVTPGSGESVPHALINAAVRAQNTYEGSGNTVFFTSPAVITDMLLEEDGIGHRLYKDMNELALALNVNKIEKVPASIIPDDIYGVILDLNDYNVGADKGGNVSMFEDFDIDYNQEKYLIETRCSGALVKPYSAITLKKGE